MTANQNPNRFRVIIVGGGIAGLALANSLQHADIDYIVLEKGRELDPQVGAGIGILPNAARILDQLGCFDDLDDLTVGMTTSTSRRQDGSIIGKKMDTLELMRVRTGYPVYVINRQLLLRVLGRHIQDPSRIRLQTSVRSVETGSDVVTVHCKDGSTVTGDIVVGADGVHSSVRHEMWRHANEAGHSSIFENDKHAMSAEYKCLFGVSPNIHGMHEGQTDRTYAKDMSTLSYVGKAGQVFWFVFAKMDKVYYPPNIPKFTEKDADHLVQEIGSLAIRENSTVTVSTLYEARETCSLVPLEEADYSHWSYGRIACLGDSIHKGTPNLGAGASSAIESAATLSNDIVRLVSETEHSPSTSAVESTFEKYQQSRTLRVGRAMKFTNTLTRVQALKGMKEYIYTHYLAPLLDDFAADSFSDYTIGATKVDHLPIPEKSLQGTMPFNAKQGWGFEPSKRERTLRALPLLLLALASSSAYMKQLTNSFAITGDPQASPSELSTIPEAFYTILLLEASRLNNKGTLAQCPVIFGIAIQYAGVGAIAPLYFFLLYRHTPVQAFRASDNRLTDASYVATIAPLLAILGLLSRFLNYSPIQLEGLPIISGDLVLRSRPYVLSAVQYLLTQTLIPSTIRHDRLWAVQNDVPWIRRTIVFMALAFVCDRVYWIANSSGQDDLAVGFWYVRAITSLSLSDLYCTIGAMYWLGLVLRDLREAGMTTTGWFSAMLTGLLSLVFLGPSATILAGWQWREELLIRRREKNAVVSDHDNSGQGNVLVDH